MAIRTVVLILLTLLSALFLVVNCPASPLQFP